MSLPLWQWSLLFQSLLLLLQRMRSRRLAPRGEGEGQGRQLPLPLDQSSIFDAVLLIHLSPSQSLDDKCILPCNAFLNLPLPNDGQQLGDLSLDVLVVVGPGDLLRVRILLFAWLHLADAPGSLEESDRGKLSLEAGDFVEDFAV